MFRPKKGASTVSHGAYSNPLLQTKTEVLSRGVPVKRSGSLSGIPSLLKKPKKDHVGLTEPSEPIKGRTRKFEVMMRRPSTRKHKTWDEDGYLMLSADNIGILRDAEDRVVARKELNPTQVQVDSELLIGGFEVCISEEISFTSSAKEVYMESSESSSSSDADDIIEETVAIDGDIAASGSEASCIVDLTSEGNPTAGGGRALSTSSNGSGTTERYEVMYRKPTPRKSAPYEYDGTVIVYPTRVVLKDLQGRIIGESLPRSILPDHELRIGNKEVKIGDRIREDTELSTPVAPVMSPFFKAKKPKSIDTAPLHDPEVGIVLPRFKSSDPVCDVVIDPYLTKTLRPHQVDGVKFLYECVMGMRKNNGGCGALLADEMGLGKTLMTITLLWTLLKQNPIAGRKPVVRKVLIVAPVTLLNNWEAEFKRWLGDIRIKVFVMNDKTKVSQFKYSRIYSVMLIGYDRMRLVADELKLCPFDILVCDEAQKLKKVDTRATQAILSLNIEKRIMLSGTPIQNNLKEFYTMCEVLNPGLLGTASSFKKQFEDPIMRGRDAKASKKHRKLAEAKVSELSSLTRGFVLRRTNELLVDSLPPRTDLVLFCKPTEEQINKYKQFCKYFDEFDHEDIEFDELEEEGEDFEKKNGDLAMMLKLKKVCNSLLLVQEGKPDWAKQSIYFGKPSMTTLQSGKMATLFGILNRLHGKSHEKVVIVSGYTQTLDLIESLLRAFKMTSVRLDGTTPAAKRQVLVDQFNRVDQRQCFAFLTSTRSGGAGINLIGGSRLFLFDCDWNPSWDTQAMARIHRMGQKKPVFIYRLLTTGCIDEKIFQRQITKQSLADRFIDQQGRATSNSFTGEELRDIFTYRGNTLSNTHDLLGCKCVSSSLDGTVAVDDDGCGSESEEDELGGWMTASQVASTGTPKGPKNLRPAMRMKNLFDYSHATPESYTGNDSVLKDFLTSGENNVTFIMSK
ncbi:DNA repair and recombination protein Rdh54p [Trichomonascus vanleenenianus]|uniref:DEAD/DEAH box helicase n=1 Tax=Trichomonascus vanleenenianus TaxID=2268995 RepID=UPI003ECA8440